MPRFRICYEVMETRCIDIDGDTEEDAVFAIESGNFDEKQSHSEVERSFVAHGAQLLDENE